MVIRFGADAGKEKVLPASRALKFRVSRIARDQILGDPGPLPDLRLPTGRIVALDPMFAGDTTALPFARAVPPGQYPVFIASPPGEDAICWAMIRLSDRPAVRWEHALTPSQLASGEDPKGCGVDSATGSFADAAFHEHVSAEEPEDLHELFDAHRVTSDDDRADVLHIDSPAGSLAAFSSNRSDGTYLSYFALDAHDRPTALLTDFQNLAWTARRPTSSN